LIDVKSIVTKEELFNWYHVEKLSHLEIAIKLGLPLTSKSMSTVSHLIDSYKIARRFKKGENLKFYQQLRKKKQVMRDGKRNETGEGKGIYIPDDATAEGTRHVQGGQSGAGNQTEA
jgi:hypothetical protein